MRIFWSVVVLFAMGFVGVGQATEVFLDIHRSRFEKIPLVVLQFHGTIGFKKKLERIETVLRQDLDASQVFDVRRLDALTMSKGIPDSPLLTQAANLGVQGAIWARLFPRGADLVLESYVFETSKGQRVVATKIIGGPNADRVLAHRLANKAIYAFTGEKGIAETRIAYVSDISGSKEIYLMDYDGAREMRVTGDQSIIISPRWSPSGNHLVYTSYREGNPDIYHLNLQSGKREKLISYSGLNISASFSPKGDRIAFASSLEGNEEIYTIGLSGGGRKRLTINQADDLSPSWSPTGTQIAFTSDRGGAPQIYIMGSAGNNVRRLTFVGDYNTSPRWSPNGDWIVYVCLSGERRLRICLTTPDGQTGRLLTEGGEWDDEAPSWAPTGHHIVFTSNRDGKRNIYSIYLDGSGLRRLTFNGGNNISPSWSPS